MIALLAWFASPLGRILSWIVGALAAAGVVAGVYFAWKDAIKAQATAEFNKKQLEQVVKDQQTMADQLAAIAKLREEGENELKTQLEAIDASTKKIEEWLNTPEAKAKDRDSSDILKEVIRMLSEGTKK